MSAISLTVSMRSNLLSLQNIASQQDIVQNRLATGLKVSSAIDNPSSYYTATSLNNRAADLTALLDAMSQGIQTVRAASEGIESATAYLAQMKSAAEQALIESLTATDGTVVSRPLEEFIAEGWQVIESGMSAAEIEALMVPGAKLVLGEDITLDRGLKITAAGVSIDGNGHSLKYTPSASGEAVILLDGGTAQADIKNIRIEASGEKVYGLRVVKGAHLKLDNLMGINVSGVGAQKLVNGNTDLYDGQSNTQAIVNQIGKQGLAAYAATQFYAPGTDKNGDFGQGNWYLPSIGEWMNVYGYDISRITSGDGETGTVGDNKAIINATLEKLKAGGADAEKLTEGYYWSSSESANDISWVFNMGNGNRDLNTKTGLYSERCFQLIENCFDPLNSSGGTGKTVIPQIGDVMYDDKSFGSADDYAAAKAAGKTAVGVITEVLDDGSVKIMNLKDLTFSATDTVNNFNPDNPYGGSVKYTHHVTSTSYSTDIAGIPNYDSSAALTAFKSGGTVEVTQTPSSSGGDMFVSADKSENFNAILEQYDQLLNDASYKGINLLRGDNLRIVFNENRDSRFEVRGTDISSQNINLHAADWKTKSDVDVSLAELSEAISCLRSLVSELGNSYSIITTRQDFTENLINVLEEGADKLTLADMNQEAANMLALQTSRQLAVNSLSLASQASQSILKLF